MNVREELLSLKDEDNAGFVRKIIPTEHPILGARMPALRSLAKKIANDDWHSFIETWGPEYLEDYMLRGLVVAYAKQDLNDRFREYSEFIPYIDNWSVCDSFCSTWKPKISEKKDVWNFIIPFLRSGKEFSMRFCAVMMLNHFVDDEHVDAVINELDSTRHDGYYYRMAAAWALSVCFARYPEKTFAYLKGKNGLDGVTFNMTVRKIVESNRVSPEMKKRIRGLV